MPIRHIALTIGVALILSACAIPMRVPANLQSADAVVPVAVEGGLLAAKQYTFGAYQTVDVDRDWTKGSASSTKFGIAASSWAERSQAYRFSLSESGTVVTSTHCLTEMAKSTVQTRVATMSFSFRQSLRCRLQRSEESSPAGQLQLDWGTGGTIHNMVTGTLKLGSDKLGVRAVFEGQSGIQVSTPLGYVIERGDEGLAAIQVSSGDKIWLQPSLPAPRRTLVATALIALGLFKNIDRGK